MGFASAWLTSGTLFPELIEEAPHRNTGIIVVVPSFNEPGIIDFLGSLSACNPPACMCEVLMVVNAPQGCDNESLLANRQTISNIKEWQSRRKSFFRLYVIDLGQPSLKKWGVGLARKTGMDEALRRFDRISNPDGVIACLDADCTVSTNYFEALENELVNKKNRRACSVYFEHPLTGDKCTPDVRDPVVQYEIHLRYYNLALKYAGFPDVFHTVGSAIAVKAVAYTKAGGMNRRQAGEDFYFVQKLVPSGGYFSLNSATVYPSPRVSARVPFGTGPVIGRMIERGEKLFLTYNPAAFKDLKKFFSLCLDISIPGDRDLESVFHQFPESIKSFIGYEEWRLKIAEIIENTSGEQSYRKRFFLWFNMFRIVKFLNQAHTIFYSKIPAGMAAKEILNLSGIGFSGDTDLELLKFIRETERSS
jgi:hypothetical protein